MAREINAELLDTKIEKAQQDFAVRYGDIIILLYHEDMMYVRELNFQPKMLLGLFQTGN